MKNETIPWSHNEFMKIKPRRQFAWLDGETMDQIAHLIASNSGPAVIFRNEVDGPWAAIGLFLVSPMHASVEAWAVTSRAMLRHRVYFDTECKSCLLYYAKEKQYESVTAHVRLDWFESYAWLEKLGFKEEYNNDVIACMKWQGTCP